MMNKMNTTAYYSFFFRFTYFFMGKAYLGFPKKKMVAANLAA